MKAAKSSLQDTLRAQYRAADFPGGLTRGKYTAKAASSNLVVLDPEIAAVFPDSESVNDALRALLRVAQHAAAVQSP